MRASAVFALALPLLAAAAPAELTARQSGNCDTGSIQCCTMTQSSTPTTLGTLSGLLGIILPTIEGLIGLGCSPLNILGLGGNSCSAQPVCCSNNSFNGLISLGCTPININL
ncbi:fungal hydrophobin-domain-containing protein [Flammula alnicola]|nr:fungal hydrophobin-domain-containing protein [Flammula alnicola]